MGSSKSLIRTRGGADTDTRRAGRKEPDRWGGGGHARNQQRRSQKNNSQVQSNQFLLLWQLMGGVTQEYLSCPRFPGSY